MARLSCALFVVDDAEALVYSRDLARDGDDDEVRSLFSAREETRANVEPFSRRLTDVTRVRDAGDVVDARTRTARARSRRARRARRRG